MISVLTATLSSRVLELAGQLDVITRELVTLHCD